MTFKMKNFRLILSKISIWICAIILVFLYGCAAQSFATFHAEKGDYKINVEIASTNEERAKGLMAREMLEKDSGMLFVFDEDALRAFWMKNTLIPLDMIFLSADKKIVSITENVQPCENNPCKSYSSLNPAKYIIEIAGGEAMKHGIKIGQSVTF